MEIVKEKYVWDDSYITYLLYDRDNYAFEFYEDIDNPACSKNIVVRRLKDDQIIKIFNKTVLFIYQTYKGYYSEDELDEEKISNFAVCDEYYDNKKYLSNYQDSEKGLAFSVGMDIDDSLIDKIFANFHIYGKDRKRKSR